MGLLFKSLPLIQTAVPNCQNPVEMYGNNYHYWQLWQKHVLLIFNKADQYHPVISTHLEKPNNLENVSVRWTAQISFFCFFVNYGGYSGK